MSYFNRNKCWAIAFLLLIALNVATLATFWLIRERRQGPPQGARSGVVDFLVKELGFDSVQKQKLLQLRDEHQQKMMEIRKQNRDAKNTFFALLQQPDVPDSALKKAAKASVLPDEQTDLLTFRHFQRIRNLCTESQKKKFDSIIQEVLRITAPPPPGSPSGPPQRPGDDRRGPPPPPQ